MTLGDYARLVERALDARLAQGPQLEQGAQPAQGPQPALREFTAPPLLNEAMRYSLMAGGKRLRPAMLLATVDMLGGDRDAALGTACAVEMIHTYSLIHDDLPGMDDDDLRRGRPTSHVVYGVGQAILAGDALQSAAYELMLETALQYPHALKEHVLAMGEIARCAGARGMVGGQSMDLLCEGGALAAHDERTLHYIHLSKTACLFIGAMRAGGRLAGANDEALCALTRYARAFGLMFQAADDLLDALGESDALGKRVGKDAREGKLTAVSLYGVPGASARVRALADEGTLALHPFGARADFFRGLIAQMLDRKA